MNRVQIMGNLGKDPEIKLTNGGKTVARLSVAVNRKYTDSQGEEKQYTEWVNVVAWGKLAEAAGNELQKGDYVYAEGRYSTRSYEKNDETRYFTEVVASVIARPIGSGGKGKEKPATKFADFGQMEYEPGEAPKKEYDQDDIPF